VILPPTPTFPLEGGRSPLLLSGGGPNSRRQNPAGDGGPGSASPPSAERRESRIQEPEFRIQNAFILTPGSWILNSLPFTDTHTDTDTLNKYRAGHGETSACFGGVNLDLPRASEGPQNPAA